MRGIRGSRIETAVFEMQGRRKGGPGKVSSLRVLSSQALSARLGFYTPNRDGAPYSSDQSRSCGLRMWVYARSLTPSVSRAIKLRPSQARRARGSRCYPRPIPWTLCARHLPPRAGHAVVTRITQSRGPLWTTRRKGLSEPANNGQGAVWANSAQLNARLSEHHRRDSCVDTGKIIRLGDLRLPG
jgi:hypothetical protein